MRCRCASAAVLLVVLLVGASCTRTGPPEPPPPEAQPARPAANVPSGPAPEIPPRHPTDPPEQAPPAEPPLELKQVEVTLVDTAAGRVLGKFPVTRPGEVVVGTDPFTLHARLQSPPPAEWFERHVRVRGSTPEPLRRELLDRGLLELTFPAGPAGEEITVRLGAVQSALANDDGVTLRLRRAREPRVALEVAADGGWRQVTSWETLPPGAAELRLRFSKAMDRRSVEAALMPALDQAGGALSWADPATLVWSVPHLPPLLEINLRDARDREGLWLAGSLPVLRSGVAPYLSAVDPITGLEQRVADLVPELFDAQVSPDSTMLLLRAYERRGGAADAPAVAWWLDLMGGARRQEDAAGHWLWLPDSRLLHLMPETGSWETVTAGGFRTTGGPLPYMRAPAAAPDGARLAGVVPRGDVESPAGDLYPADLVLVQLGEGSSRTLPDFVRVYSPSYEWTIRLTLSWSPDGRRLATLGDTPDGAELVVADPALGVARAQVRPLPDLRYGSTFETRWSPTGAHILAGPLILDAATLATLSRLPAAGGGEALRNTSWSPDGQWILYTDQWDDWGPVFAYHLPSGTVARLGSGLPAGWDGAGRALVARWEGAEHRYRPPHG